MTRMSIVAEKKIPFIAPALLTFYYNLSFLEVIFCTSHSLWADEDAKSECGQDNDECYP